ncbi:hypothetical protein Axi01nite_84890 [Actinoplanes xinjiangensis]|nr:hypothetical protein Axi01nite_84890 [Actinoplanes xinjiangensis]
MDARLGPDVPQPALRRRQCLAHRSTDPAVPVDPILDLLDQAQACRQEAAPVVRPRGDRQTAIEPGEDPLGQDVAELLPAGPARIGKRVVGLLQRPAHLADRAEAGIVEQEEPVLVVDLRKERVDPVRRYRQGTAADEGVLLVVAGLPVGMAHHGVVGITTDLQPHTVVGVEQGGGPLQIGGVRHGDVVVQEDDGAPPGHPGEDQAEVALGAGVGPALQA